MVVHVNVNDARKLYRERQNIRLTFDEGVALSNVTLQILILQYAYSLSLSISLYRHTSSHCHSPDGNETEGDGRKNKIVLVGRIT